jgi:hypothetical protein
LKAPFVIAAIVAVFLSCMLYVVHQGPISGPVDPLIEPVFFVSRALAYPGFITSSLIPWFVLLPHGVLNSDLLFAAVTTVVNTILYWRIVLVMNKTLAFWRSRR